MDSLSVLFLIVGGIYLGFAWYTYSCLSVIVSKKWNPLLISGVVLSTALVLFSFFKLFKTIQADVFFRDMSYSFYLGIVLLFVIPILLFSTIMLLQDIGRLVGGLKNYWSKRVENPEGEKVFMPSRRKAFTWLAAGVAALPFATILHGITRGKYNFKVKTVKLTFKDLPKAFDGFKIVQISDIHAGSLDSKEDILRGVELVNEQSPDLIVFTGDLVNSVKDEINPFIDIFKKLKSKMGQFAVLGNHDYHGAPFNTDESIIKEYWSDFKSKFDAMGFQLLNNENAKIEKGGEYIRLLGVENWGLGDWFPQEGDLDKALENCEEKEFSVLLSHDPSHWNHKVLDHKKHIHLTLSGHTHGMQLGFNLPGFKWSPAKFRYPQWMGLYKEKNQYLYVNTGFGFLVFPGRIGIWPEITVFELSKAD